MVPNKHLRMNGQSEIMVPQSTYVNSLELDHVAGRYESNEEFLPTLPVHSRLHLDEMNGTDDWRSRFMPANDTTADQPDILGRDMNLLSSGLDTPNTPTTMDPSSQGFSGQLNSMVHAATQHDACQYVVKTVEPFLSLHWLMSLVLIIATYLFGRFRTDMYRPDVMADMVLGVDYAIDDTVDPLGDPQP
jgi:hypothetical protein